MATEKLVEWIYKLVTKYNLDGIRIDTMKYQNGSRINLDSLQEFSKLEKHSKEILDMLQIIKIIWIQFLIISYIILLKVVFVVILKILKAIGSTIEINNKRFLNRCPDRG